MACRPQPPIASPPWPRISAPSDALPDGSQAALGRTLAGGVLIGAANALGLLGFEWVVDNLQELIWNDWAGSDDTRWLVVPLAIAGSIALSLTVRATGQQRMMAPHTDVLAEVDKVQPGTLRMIAILLLTGVVSLVGGASLGPEGALLPASIALGAWVAGHRRVSGPVTELLVLSSIGALLVSFFGSILPAPIPLLIMRRQGKPLNRRSVIPPLAAGVTAWIIVSVIRGSAQGHDIVPIDSGGTLSAVLPALGMGVLAVFVGVLVRLVIRATVGWTERMDRLWHWIAAAAVFGAVIGVLYWIGGESVQFSGQTGTQELYDDRAQYGVAALLGLLLVKLVATAWSISAGLSRRPGVPVGVHGRRAEPRHHHGDPGHLRDRGHGRRDRRHPRRDDHARGRDHHGPVADADEPAADRHRGRARSGRRPPRARARDAARRAEARAVGPARKGCGERLRRPVPGPARLSPPNTSRPKTRGGRGDGT